MDVTTILPALRAAKYFTVEEEQTILADPRRRDRVALFLDMVAKKGTETFKAFSNVLADQSPHLYLTMSEWDKEDHFDSGGPSLSGSCTSNNFTLVLYDFVRPIIYTTALL